LDHRGLLVRGEEGSLSGMTENHQAFDVFEAAEPGAEPLNGGVVDLAIAGKRGNRRGNETSQIKGFHVISSDGLNIEWTVRAAPIAWDQPMKGLDISEDSDRAFQI
jgi:hypothetical protein